MNTDSHLEIVGLTEIELLEFEEECHDQVIQRSPANASRESEHGDLGLTAAVVILTAAAVQGLAVWLAKRRVEDIKLTNVSITKGADGSFQMDLSRLEHGKKTESPDAQVVRALRSQLTELLQLDTKP
jgi:hypothetical protein